ncbi:calcium channel protein, partial [Mortierella sp. GBA43]
MIRNSTAYVYLSIFQVLRIYRPIIYIPSLRDLIRRVIGGWRNLLGLVFSILMFLFTGSVMAGIMFRDVVPAEAHSMNFSDFYVSYLGMYQIFSGENWTDILYTVISVDMPQHRLVLNGIFVVCFYSFANFVLVNMIVAIATENFGDTGDKKKREEQIKNYAARKIFIHAPEESSKEPNDSGKTKPFTKKDSGKARRENRFTAYLREHLREHKPPVGPESYPSESIDTVPEEFGCDFFYTEEELFCDDGMDQNKRIHPVYFHQEGRKGCQHDLNRDKAGRFRRIFASDYKFKELWRKQPNTTGNTDDGDFDYVLARNIFELFIALAIFASVIVAVITTPVWRFHQSQLDPQDRSDIVTLTDSIFIAVFMLEFIIRF